MSEIRAQLSRCPIKTRLSLTGTLVVARDIAHAKLMERLQAGMVCGVHGVVGARVGDCRGGEGSSW